MPSRTAWNLSMRCCSWAASWLSSGSVTIGNFLPLDYAVLKNWARISFPETADGCPHISLVLRDVGFHFSVDLPNAARSRTEREKSAAGAKALVLLALFGTTEVVP